MVCPRLIAGLVIGAAAFAAPRVEQYRAELHASGSQTYTVDISVATSGEAWSQPSYTFDGKVLERIVPHDPRHLSYSVHTAASRVRIPLAVPEISTAGLPRSVLIDVVLPPGYVIAGDMFPLFERNDSGAYVAELANIPSHVEFEIAPADQASLRQRWLIPAVFSDSAVIVFLIVGSIVRLFLRKPREG